MTERALKFSIIIYMPLENGVFVQSEIERYWTKSKSFRCLLIFIMTILIYL